MKRHRPGTADERDPEIAEALRLVSSDSELAHWWKRYQESQAAIRDALRRVKPPAGLREQIIAEKPQLQAGFAARWKWALAATAALAIVALLAIFLPQPERSRFDRFETRMVKDALRMYEMDLETNDPDEIRAFLASAGAPADYELPQALTGVELTGCATNTFEGAPVSMICFKTRDELAPGSKSDLWLFVTGTSAVPGSPTGPQPIFKTKGNATTAAWSSGGSSYLLVTAQSEEHLRSLL